MSDRLSDWRTRLHWWAEGIEGAPFAWGKTDCATLAREALHIMFGVDVARDRFDQPLPRWEDERAAAAVRKRHGDVRAVLLRLGALEGQLGFVRAGDIGWLPNGLEAEGLGAALVYVDPFFLGSHGEAGVYRVRIEDVPRETTVLSLWSVS